MEPQVVKAGAPERAEFQMPKAAPKNMSEPPAGAEPPAPEPPAPELELTEDQVRGFLKKQGIEFESFEDIIAKFAPTTAPPQKTPEDIAKEEAAIEKRMVDVYLGSGGTIEQYSAMKSIAAMDGKELAKESTIKELREAGFDDKSIEEIIRERYYQIDLESLEQDEDNETEEEFQARKSMLQKKHEYGSKKFENRSSHLKQNAEQFLNTLREAVTEQDLQKQKEDEFLANVDKTLAKFPRKMTFELGEVDNQKIDPIQYEVPDTVIAKVQETLKDPAKRKQYFFNEQGELDLDKVVEVMAKNEGLTSMLKTALLEGGTRQVNILKSIFPDNPHLVGVGGATTKGAPGKIASAGKPQRVPQNN